MLVRIATAVVLVPAVLALLLFAPPIYVTIASGLVALLAVLEFLKIAEAAGFKPFRLLALIGTIAVFAAVVAEPQMVLPALAITATAMLTQGMWIAPLEGGAGGILGRVSASFFPLIYVVFPMATIPLLVSIESGRSLVLLLFLVVWVGDTAALFVGRSLGHNPMAPDISPKKTWEGALGSMVATILTVLVALMLSAHINGRFLSGPPFAGRLLYWIGIAVLLNLAAQLGDLLESALKRGAGVKDSGTILPGHGGVLDRIDALLLAAPVLWYAQLTQSLFFS